MRTVDVHQHLWPERLVLALERRTEPPRLRGSLLELPCEGPLRDRTSRRTCPSSASRFSIAAASTSPSSRSAPTWSSSSIRIFATPTTKGSRSSSAAAGGRLPRPCRRPLPAGLRRRLRLGRGWSSPGATRCSAELEAAGQVLFVHPGPPRGPAPVGAPAWWAAGRRLHGPDAGRLCGLALPRRRPLLRSLRVVFAILAGGAPVQLERLRSRGGRRATALRPNVYFDRRPTGRARSSSASTAFGAGQLAVRKRRARDRSRRRRSRPCSSLGESVAGRVCEENPARLLGALR